MASKGLQQYLAEIQELVGTHDTIEAEHVIDSLFKNMGKGKMSDKESGLRAIESELGDSWEDTLNQTVLDMGKRYANDRLPKLALSDSGESLPSAGQVDALSRDLPDVLRDAGDNYIAALLYHKMQKPKSDSPHTGQERDLILTSFFAGVQGGASYIVLSHPPQIFLDRVLQVDGVSRDSYTATIKDAMEDTTPFLKQCVMCAKSNAQELQRMQQDYQSLFRETTADAMEPVMEEDEDDARQEPVRSTKIDRDTEASRRPGGGIKGFFKSLGNGIAAIFGNHSQHKVLVEGAANRYCAARDKVKGKLGKKMIWIYKLAATLNVIALFLRVLALVVSFFVDVTGRTTNAVSSALSWIPIIGKSLSKGVKVVSASGIRIGIVTSSIPWIITLCVLLWVTRSALKRKEEKQRETIFEMLLSMMAICCVLVSIYVLWRFGLAVVAGLADTKYFWAMFYAVFT